MALAPLLAAGAGAAGLRTGSGGRSAPLSAGVGAFVGPAYMLPASLSITGDGKGEADGSIRFPARNRSTIAAISWRSILPPATTGSFAATGCETGCVLTAGRVLLTGRVSNATRLISIK